jgi:hypothetical protein
MIFILGRESNIQMKKNNEAIIEYLKDIDPQFRQEGNVVFAEKAFIVKSVIDWCRKSKLTEKLSSNQVRAYLTLIHQFVKGEIHLFWLEDTVTYTKIIRSGDNAEEI